MIPLLAGLAAPEMHKSLLSASELLLVALLLTAGLVLIFSAIFVSEIPDRPNKRSIRGPVMVILTALSFVCLALSLWQFATRIITTTNSTVENQHYTVDWLDDTYGIDTDRQEAIQLLTGRSLTVQYDDQPTEIRFVDDGTGHVVLVYADRTTITPIPAITNG